MLNHLKTLNSSQAIFIAGLFLVSVTLLLFFTGTLRQQISGEALYDLYFPAQHSFGESISSFISERDSSRVFHGIVIATLYEVFGFAPPLYYLLSGLLVVLAAVFAALSISRLIRPWQSFLLTIAFSTLPLVIPELVNIKKIHHLVAWCAYWVAIYCLQRWARSKEKGWIGLTALSFGIGLLSYEAIAFLLPVGFFIAFPQIKNLKEGWSLLAVIAVICATAFMVFLAVELLKSSNELRGTGGLSLFDILDRIALRFGELPRAFWDLGILVTPYYRDTPTINIYKMSMVGIFFVFLLGLFQTVRTEPRRLLTSPWFALAIAGLWLAVFGFLPFTIAGQHPDIDSLKGAAFGFLFLATGGALFLGNSGKRQIASIYLFLICLLFIWVGAQNFSRITPRIAINDRVFTNMVISLKETVPAVRENTIFVFVNSPFDGTGCFGMTNMLYARQNLTCLHLYDGDTSAHYLRTEGGLVEIDGREYQEDFIVLQLDPAGNVEMVSITESEFPELPITWESASPIETNPERIRQVNIPITDFYRYAVHHKEAFK